MVKIKLNEVIQFDGVIHGKGETIEVSDNMYNTLITDNIQIEKVEEPKYKRKEKSEDDI